MELIWSEGRITAVIKNGGHGERLELHQAVRLSRPVPSLDLPISQNGKITAFYEPGRGGLTSDVVQVEFPNRKIRMLKPKELTAA